MAIKAAIKTALMTPLMFASLTLMEVLIMRFSPEVTEVPDIRISYIQRYANVGLNCFKSIL